MRADRLAGRPAECGAVFTHANRGYRRYAQQRLRHREDSQGAVQNAGAALYKNWRRALGSADPQAYAFKIVKDA
ncbi:hypothetical protein VM98_39115, partial [Streptomyces rubellomurinus subsp. indigoferus]